RTEAVLSDTLELLQTAESIGKSGGWFVDVSSGRAEWSTGLYRVYGLAGHEPPGYETHLQCVHPEDRELHNKIFTENQHSRKTHFSHEYRLRLRGGEVRYVLGRYEIIRDNEGQPLYIRGTDRDITDQKLLEQERELLKSAIEQAAESVVITDSEGIIQYANPAFEKMTGFSPDEAIGSKSNIVKGEKIDPLVFSQMWDTLNQAKVWNGNIINNTKDGDHYEEELSISPIKDREGTVSHYVAVSRDVSKEVALENQLRQAMKMEAIGTLTGGIAHDFNNILSGIIGYSEFIQSHVEPDSEVGEDIESILIATRRATDLVRQLLTFSRKVDDKKGPVSIHKVVQDSVKMVRATLPSSIRIEEDIVECGMIIANPINIHQIVINLCTNALHAIADHKGTIGVSLQSRNLTGAALPLNQDVEPGDFAVLTVVDSGCGMARGMLERIFEPYFTTKEMESGTGLGLSVVHGIVQGCKGFIEVESEVGSGTSFHVFFPVAEDLPLEREEEPRKKVEIPAGGGERVMIVDDEPFLVTINKKRLENFGYKVASFTDSKEAYEAFQKRPDDYDLLVTDQTMPGMTGLDLAKGLLAIKPSLPIIMCTGHSETTPKEKALEAGVSKYVYKPLYGDELLLAVLELLRENGKE
ncbi:MAG: PAS domain S-box protein, partial [Thermodesulfobacteriota bacterium]